MDSGKGEMCSQVKEDGGQMVAFYHNQILFILNTVQ